MVDTANHTGVMIALMLPDGAAQQLYGQVAPTLIAAGLTPALPSEYHITLIYLGESSNPKVSGNIPGVGLCLSNDFVNDGRFRPMTGQIGGVGRFVAAETDQDALYASLDMVDLPALRQAIYERVEQIGALPPQTHGFTPHITLAYCPTDGPMPDVRLTPIPAVFDRITLAVGDNHVDFRLDYDDGDKAVKKYTVVAHSGDKYAVHEQGDDGQPAGDPIATHKTRAEADAHVSELGKKDWDDGPYVASSLPASSPSLSPDDPRVAYNPVGGMKGGKACANCAWFIASGNACQLVSGPIVPTGLSNLWLKQYEYQPDPIQVEIVNQGSAEQPRKNLIDQVKELLSGRKQDEAVGFKVLPDHRWIAYWSNNFEDKEGEIFTEKAHDNYISRVDSGKVPLPELWYWHVPGTRHGQAEWLGRVDHINVAVGRFDDTPAGRAFEGFYSRKVKAHKVSHGYLYPRSLKQNGVYHDYTTFEISPLPAGREANAITGFSSVQEMKEMPVTEEKRRALESILGKELAAQTIDNAERQSKEAEALGVKFKEATDPITAIDAEVREAVKEIARARATDAEGVKALDTKLETILTAVKGIQDGEAARNTRMTQLEEATKAMFELQASPRQSNNTALPPDNPLVKALSEAQNAQKAAGDSNLGVFDFFVKSAQTQAPGGQ